MSETGTLSELQEIFRRIFSDPALVIHPSTSAKDVRRWDSLNHMHLIAEVEKRFRVEFVFDEVRGLQNVGDLVRLILRKKNP